MENREYRKVFDQSSLIMVIVKADYTVSAASKGFLDATFNDRESIIGREIFDVFPKIGEDIESVLVNTMRESFTKVLREKKTDTTAVVRYDIPNSDSGENGFDIRYWKTINTPIFDEEENVRYIKQVYVDVTDSEELSTQLALEKGNLDEKKSAEKYIRNTFKQTPVPVCVLRGPKHIFEMVNDEFLRVAGRKKYEGKPAREVLPELEGQEFFEILDEVYESEKPYVGSEIPTTLQSDGESDGETKEKFVDFIYQILYDSDGNKEGIFVMGVEVTDRVIAQRELEESEKTLKQLLNSVPQKISHSDEFGNMIFFNKRWLDDTGYTEEELMGDGWLKTVHPDDAEETKQIWDDSVQSGTAVKGECRIIDKNSVYRWNLNRAAPIENEVGEIKMWVDTKTDIHDRKKHEKILEKAVAERTEELEAFTRITSHDLQEPLRKIQMFAGRVRDNEYQNLSEKGIHYFEVMQDAARRMHNLIEDLLAFSNIKNGGQKFEEVDLAQLIEEVKAEYKEIIEEKNATVEVAETCRVPVITFQFRQLMSNLISNSLKYSKPDTPPHIIIKGEYLTGDELIKEKPSKLKGKLIPEKKYSYIRIEDNGIGFDPGYGDSIFEVFQRLHSRNEYEGTGIGLAIVKKVVEYHQGAITAEGKPNEGAVFDIYLPTDQE